MTKLDEITLNGMRRDIARAEALLAEESNNEQLQWNERALLISLHLMQSFHLYHEMQMQPEFADVLVRMWQLYTHFWAEVDRRVNGNTSGWE